MITQIAAPLKDWINAMHEGNVTHAALALGVDRSTLHRVMDSAYVIGGTLYTMKRKAISDVERLNAMGKAASNIKSK